MSCWSPLLLRDLRLGSFEITREVREEGSRYLLGNKSTSSHPHSMLNRVREASLCKPQSTWGVSWLQFRISSSCRLEGKPSFWNNTSGQSCKLSSPRDEWVSASSLSWEQRSMQHNFKLRADNSICTRLGHALMRKSQRNGGSPSEIEMERDSSPWRPTDVKPWLLILFYNIFYKYFL